MTTKDRLISFLAYLKMGQDKFEKSVGLSRGFVNNVGDSIRRSSLEKITTVYPELNTAWLLTGVGNMLNETSTSPNTHIDDRSTNYSGVFNEPINTQIIGRAHHIINSLQFKDSNEKSSREVELEKEILKLTKDLEFMVTQINSLKQINMIQEQLLKEKDRIIVLLLERK